MTVRSGKDFMTIPGAQNPPPMRGAAIRYGDPDGDGTCEMLEQEIRK